jgi:hypothetical protein
VRSGGKKKIAEARGQRVEAVSRGNEQRQGTTTQILGKRAIDRQQSIFYFEEKRVTEDGVFL